MRTVARDLMTLRPCILWLNQNDTHETVWHKVSDLIFAVHSIPAIFGVTLAPSLSIPQMYSRLWGAGAVDKFHYLRTALGLVLGFVGVKMLLAHSAYKIDTLVALGVVVAVLGVALIASLVRTRKGTRRSPA